MKLAVALLLGVLTAFAMPSSAHAGSAQAGAITAVSVSPTNPGLRAPVTVDVSFCVPAGTKDGDTFSLTLPARLTPMTSGFSVTDSSGGTVADITVAAGNFTLTMTKYASSHTGICGSAYFQESIVAGWVKPNQPVHLMFTSADKVFDEVITPVLGVVPSPSQPLEYGTWTYIAEEDQLGARGALTWYVQAPRAPAPHGQTRLTLSAIAGAGQSFVCSGVALQLGTVDAAGNYNYIGPYPGSPSVDCSETHVSVTTGAVSAGRTVRLAVPATVTDSALAEYLGSGSARADGRRTVRLVGGPVVRAKAGGLATGRPGPGSSSDSRSHGANGTSASSSGLSRAASVALLVMVVVFGAVLIFLLRRRARRVGTS